MTDSAFKHKIVDKKKFKKAKFTSAKAMEHSSVYHNMITVFFMSKNKCYIYLCCCIEYVQQLELDWISWMGRVNGHGSN